MYKTINIFLLIILACIIFAYKYTIEEMKSGHDYINSPVKNAPLINTSCYNYGSVSLGSKNEYKVIDKQVCRNDEVK